MKQLLTLMLIVLLSCDAYSQFSAGMHIGSSNKYIVAGLNSQYQFNNRFAMGFNITSHLDDSNPAFFQGRFGYTLGNFRGGFSVLPYTGFSYAIQNIEQKNYGGHLTGGVELRYQLTNAALLYTDVNIPAPGYLMVSFGIAGKFFKRVNGNLGKGTRGSSQKANSDKNLARTGTSMNKNGPAQ